MPKFSQLAGKIAYPLNIDSKEVAVKMSGCLILSGAHACRIRKTGVLTFKDKPSADGLALEPASNFVEVNSPPSLGG